MAFRPEEHVVRGEIDNRTRDRVVGRIWFIDRAEPVELELKGNAWADLAGRRLEFVNPKPQPGDSSFLEPLQRGVIGDCTASRKVRVPDVSEEELDELYKARKPFPWHWSNSLYLEWHSDTNGRIVIESADYRLTIVGDAAWEMTPDEEAEQRKANGQTLTQFMDQLIAAAEAEAAGDQDETDDDLEAEERPMTEEEAEAMEAESEKLVDRIQFRLEREGPGADYEKILEEELERRRRERGEEPLTPEEEARRDERLEAMNRAAEEARANPDSPIESFLNRKHPLAERSFELSGRIWEDIEARGWEPGNASAEHPVVELITSANSASAKLAGALNGYVWPPSVEFCAGHIVRLKRARGYLDDALAAAADCADQNLVDADWIAPVRHELTNLAQAADALIAELRARLSRGSE